MPLRPFDRRPWVLARAGVVLYVLFLVASPFEHHDLACELRTPRHCTACTASVVGADPEGPATLDASNLTDAGKAVSALLLSDGVVLPARSTGRSPPVVR